MATGNNSEGSTQESNSRQANHLRDLRAIHTKRLWILELQSAKFGVSVPPHILLEIEEIRAEISEIDLQIQNALPPINQGDNKEN